MGLSRTTICYLNGLAESYKLLYVADFSESVCSEGIGAVGAQVGTRRDGVRRLAFLRTALLHVGAAVIDARVCL